MVIFFPVRLFRRRQNADELAGVSRRNNNNVQGARLQSGVTPLG